jgi:hypothetical protein
MKQTMRQHIFAALGGPFPLADPSASNAGSFLPGGIYVPSSGLTWNGFAHVHGCG